MYTWLRWRLTANIFTRADSDEEWEIEVNGPCLNALDDIAIKRFFFALMRCLHDLFLTKMNENQLIFLQFNLD